MVAYLEKRALLSNFESSKKIRISFAFFLLSSDGDNRILLKIQCETYTCKYQKEQLLRLRSLVFLAVSATFDATKFSETNRAVAESQAALMFRMVAYLEKRALLNLAPQFKLAFPEKTVRQGSFVSLICIANGNPAPQVKWTLDGIWTLSTRPGVLVSTYLSGGGDVISYVNITSADVTDSGVYSCTAFNEAGKAVHSRRLNVFGSLFIRPLNNLTALAGGVFKVMCPFGGYPFDSIIWKRGKF
ncbi:down syndrome cell adhesion molecule homolog [Caerostris darwini]|uniref:Down syndrome cell adhesion molecule homolog n=1 Tax=Caerostris darwini TaxID=1538125 RepID=A0AAV4RBL8_9ARAC|nr:down syndrome cell adhesion molecule homolog [Caerostris darwini]